MTAGSSMLSFHTYSSERKNNFFSTQVRKVGFKVLEFLMTLCIVGGKLDYFIYLFMNFTIDKTKWKSINKENKSIEDQNSLYERQT